MALSTQHHKGDTWNDERKGMGMNEDSEQKWGSLMQNLAKIITSKWRLISSNPSANFQPKKNEQHQTGKGQIASNVTTEVFSVCLHSLKNSRLFGRELPKTFPESDSGPMKGGKICKCQWCDTFDELSKFNTYCMIFNVPTWWQKIKKLCFAVSFRQPG